jgi:hypothetical protein
MLYHHQVLDAMIAVKKPIEKRDLSVIDLAGVLEYYKQRCQFKGSLASAIACLKESGYSVFVP